MDIIEPAMDTVSDSRFDSNHAIQFLLEITHEHSLENLLTKLVARGIEHPKAASVQIWLFEKGDLCASCAMRSQCSDQSHCFHLMAGRSKSLDATVSQTSFFGKPMPTRLPLGLTFLDKVATTGQRWMLTEEDPAWKGLVDLDWMQEEHIRSINLTPISFKGTLLGILAGFSREHVTGNFELWGQVFADYIGAAIANARAFEEIERLKAQLEQQNTYLQEEVVEAKAFGDLVGQSAALRHIVSQIDLVAPTEASVLILGETGTGKELVAHEIHHRSARKSGPLVRVNCASIPRDLFESEFFGHARGAFTGALNDRAGRFETADRGTLLLDEVGEIPLDMQGKLLRVLQEKRYERVGEDRTRSADVRIIGATNRDLKQAVASGRFREDLYYRLNVFPIEVPPLRKRRDDIALLARHFIDLSVRELKCPQPRLTKAAIVRLQAYDWPGNVRELRNVVERAVILAQGGALNFDLPITNSPSPLPSSGPTAETANIPDVCTDLEMQQRQRENLLAALKRTHWRVKGKDGAAELLGIKPATLFYRIRKTQIRLPENQTPPA